MVERQVEALRQRRFESDREPPSFFCVRGVIGSRARSRAVWLTAMRVRSPPSAPFSEIKEYNDRMNRKELNDLITKVMSTSAGREEFADSMILPIVPDEFRARIMAKREVWNKGCIEVREECNARVA